jgi:hypothetical protein
MAAMHLPSLSKGPISPHQRIELLRIRERSHVVWYAEHTLDSYIRPLWNGGTPVGPRSRTFRSAMRASAP